MTWRHRCNTFATSALEVLVGEYHDPAALLPGGPRKHCTRGGVGLGDGLDGHGKSHLPGFDPSTVQPVASRYNANVPDSSTKKRKRKALVMSNA